MRLLAAVALLAVACSPAMSTPADGVGGGSGDGSGGLATGGAPSGSGGSESGGSSPAATGGETISTGGTPPSSGGAPSFTCDWIPECSSEECSVAYGADCGAVRMGTFSCGGSVSGFTFDDETAFPCAADDCSEAAMESASYCATVSQESGAGGTAATDTDGDGVPDTSDTCPGFDDLQDLNGNGSPDACEPGWCQDGSDNCTIANGFRQGYCIQEPGPEAGTCTPCPSGRYDCNDDPSDGCEAMAQSHPCPP